MKKSLQLKLLYSFTLIIIVMLVCVSFGVAMIIRGEMVAGKEAELKEKGNELAQAIYEFQQTHGSLKQLPEYLSKVNGFIDGRVWIVNSSQQVIVISGGPRGAYRVGGHRMTMAGMPPPPPGPGRLLEVPEERNVIAELTPVFSGETVSKILDHPFYGEKMLIVAVPILTAERTVMGAVLLNAPIMEINVFMERIYYYIGLAGAAALVLALIMVHWLTRSIVRPLKEMQETAGKMAAGDYTASVTVRSEDEVGELGRALNALAQDLSRYIGEVNQQEKLRRDFVANISHEFRTPMTIIRGYNEALLDGTIDNALQIQKYHKLITEETVRLERLINDLLDLSRLQSGAKNIDMEELPLPELVDSVVLRLQQRAEQKSVTIVTDYAAGLPPVRGNGDRIIQLILIIMDNAVKYTLPEGSVTVSIQENNGVEVQIADTGIGIPREDLPYIWERLYKVDKAHCRADQGTGLGLAIAKEIIEVHGLAVSVTSQLGKGTIFTVKFPWQLR